MTLGSDGLHTLTATVRFFSGRGFALMGFTPWRGSSVFVWTWQCDRLGAHMGRPPVARDMALKLQGAGASHAACMHYVQQFAAAAFDSDYS